MSPQPAIPIEKTVWWLQERHDNCLRIMATKTGKDRAGWAEDASYFRATIELIRRAYQ